MKRNILFILSIVCFLVVVGFAGFAVYKELEQNKTSNVDKEETKEETKAKEEKTECKEYTGAGSECPTEVFNVTDGLLRRFSFTPMTLSLDDSDLSKTLFSSKVEVGADDLTPEQKFYMTVLYYAGSKNIDLMDGEKHSVKVSELKDLLFKDSSYFDKIQKPTEYYNFGEFQYYVKDDTLYFTTGIFGEVGPTSKVESSVISAYKTKDKLYVTFNFIYYDFVDMDEDNNLSYDIYDGFKVTKVDTYNEAEKLWYEPDYSKFSKYTFEYKVDGDKYYFERVAKK